MKVDLEKICEKFEKCLDKKICDGYGNLDLGRYEQFCNDYKTKVKGKRCIK